MKILFITPTGGRTGSEMMLDYLLHHLNGTSINATLYAPQAGELIRSSSLKNTYTYPYKRGFIHQIYEGIYAKFTKHTPEDAILKRLNNKLKPDFWYLNTLTLARFGRLAQKLGVPYIVHLHELPQLYDSLKYDEFVAYLTQAKLIIGCSSVVIKRLQQMGFQKLALLHEFIDHERIEVNTTPEQIRDTLNIPTDAYVWVMSGTLSIRKGYDMVPDLLAQLPKNTYLLWLGGGRDSGLRYYVEQRVEREGLNFRFLGELSNNYYEYLNAADGFVLLAREDPFPLVMMEAAYLQKPLVGFNSGGIQEFVTEGVGAVVEGFDVHSLAQTMQQIMDGTVLIAPDRMRARSLEFSVKNQLPKWLKIIENV
jgi:L-malate glycosyltransferase